MRNTLAWQWVAALACLWLAVPTPGFAAAENIPQQTNEELSKAGPKAGDALGKKPEPDGSPSFVFLPIPRSDPTMGTGVTLVGAVLYNPNDSPHPWVTGVGALATNNGSRALGAGQQASFLEDSVRLLAGFGKADLNLRFYGIGEAAASRQIFVPINEDGRFVLVQGLYGVTKELFVGLRYIDLRVTTTIDTNEVSNRFGLNLPPIELDHRTSMLGPAVEYDSRDNQFEPTQGIYGTMQLMFATPKLGGDVSYRSLRSTYAQYWPVLPDVVFAGQLSLCALDGNVPFTELCLYGTGNDLRGYTGGQYRDRTMYTAQGEARWQFAERWGAVLFAGTGAVANRFSDLLSVTQLPAAGVGLRWLASKQYKVNISVDVAAGRDGSAVYLYIGEAF
ncbi:MAG TPA: BamA/TamA family outer membrane protein [Burkholderiaceae bacterium]